MMTMTLIKMTRAIYMLCSYLSLWLGKYQKKEIPKFGKLHKLWFLELQMLWRNRKMGFSHDLFYDDDDDEIFYPR